MLSALPAVGADVSTATFNVAGSQNADGYTAYVESGGNSFAWEAVGGTGNPASGGLKATVATGNNTGRRSSTVRKIASSSSSTVSAWETSLDFRFDGGFAQTDASRTAEFWLGFSAWTGNPSSDNDRTHRIFSRTDSGDGARSMSVYVKGASTSSSQKSLSVSLYSGGAIQATTTFAPTITASAAYFDHWLRITYRLERNGSTYSASYRLDDLGVDGTGAPALIQQSGVHNYSNSYLSDATANTYAAFSLATTTATNVATKAAIFADNHTVSVTTAAPEAPTALAATAATTTRLTANWQAPATGVPPTGYILEVVKGVAPFEAGDFIAADGAGNQESGIAVGNLTSQALTGLERSTAYRYQIRATNAVGAGDASTVIETGTIANSPPTLDLIASPPPPIPRGHHHQGGGTFRNQHGWG